MLTSHAEHGTPVLDTVLQFTKTHRQHHRVYRALNQLRRYVGVAKVKETIARDVMICLALMQTGNSTVVTRSMNGAIEGRHAPHVDTVDTDTDDEAATTSSDTSDDSDVEPVQEVPAYGRSLKLHTLILGEPGTGKTSMARVLMNIWTSLRLVRPDRCRTVTRRDLVGRFHGHTQKKVRKVLKSCQNGVLFIDEAYMLAASGDDQFGREALTEIMDSMLHPDYNVVVIMAGYGRTVRESILSQNPGLERRFGRILTMHKPPAAQLLHVFVALARRAKYRVRKTPLLQSLFKQATFPHGAGDMHILFDFTVSAHVLRCWPSRPTHRLQLADVRSGFDSLRQHYSTHSQRDVSMLYV